MLLLKLVFLLQFLFTRSTSQDQANFIYNGFSTHNLTLTVDGIADFTTNGLLRLTNDTELQQGHAFYSTPIRFKNSSTPSGIACSFSTTFVFAHLSEFKNRGGHGMAFVIAPQPGLPGSRPGSYLGLFYEGNNGNATNHVLAVELDTINSSGYSDISDINNNHVAIDVNGLMSKAAMPASYFVDNSAGFNNLTLASGNPMQLWIEYSSVENQINVTLAPLKVRKPSVPLLSYGIDLSMIFNESMYVGFSASTGSVVTSHYVLAWSFKLNGEAQALDLSKLPKLPASKTKKRSMFLLSGLPVISVSVVFVGSLASIFIARRKKKFAEEVEDWEADYRPQRFKYKDLYIATKGFKDNELLGKGGFGRVYKGVLPSSKLEIAVKRVSHESRQGMRQFIAEIVSIGRLRHRNLVSLLGYCRRKDELLLVYDYMHNGSLDKYLHQPQDNNTLNWSTRFKVIKNVASGLLYLHEGWDQVVIHRDIKASNVLLDREMNGRLGDFGLARLYDHGTDPQTTHIVGTFGYLAPEHAKTGKATKSTDVYAFGAFLLEVACGRRPIEPDKEVVLVDEIYLLWTKGNILQARDPCLGFQYMDDEVELVLKLGLLCSHPDPITRPTMSQVVQYLEQNVPLPDLALLRFPACGFNSNQSPGFSNFALSSSSSTEEQAFACSSSSESLVP